MKKLPSSSSPLICILIFFSLNATSQIAAPEAEDVYGGRILGMTSIDLGNDSSRIFISAESANSLFMADVHAPNAAQASSTGFSVLPVGDASAGLGSNIQYIASHSGSKAILFGQQGGLSISLPPYTTSSSLSTFTISDVLVEGNQVFWIDGGNFNFGSLDLAGNYTAGAGSPIALPSSSFPAQMVIHPSSNLVYILRGGNTPALYRSSDAVGAISASTSFSTVPTPGFSTTVDWRALGISSSGRIFIGGHESAPPSKFMRYTDNELIWLDVVFSGSTGNGVSGTNIASGLNNHMYFGASYSTDNGLTWLQLGNGGLETHPNDGRVMIHPVHDSIVFMTSDQGLAISLNGGNQMAEINDGIEAVQVNDFDMTSDKETAWLASKSGIRKVTNYQSSAQWTNGIFPNDDGSPYYSVAMANDTDRVYVGNVRVYKTIDGGSSWTSVFTPEDPPYNFPGFASGVMALEVASWDSSLVMAGVQVFDQEEGGLFVSQDDGNSWSQILIEASSQGYDVDVSDIGLSIEGNDTVAYISVLYDLSSPQGRSLYRLVKSSSSWTPSQEMNPSGTSTGSAIVASLEDVFVSSTGDTILTVGTDAGSNHPIAYYKVNSGTGLWTPFTPSGFPFVAGKKGKAITMGMGDTIYCAVDHEIYYHTSTTAWNLGYAYPNGTAINFLFFDDLLAGTGTGLYNHPSSGGSISMEEPIHAENVFNARLFPNPTQAWFEVHFESPRSKSISIRVFAINGQIVHSQRYLDTEIRINSKSWPRGLYLVKLRDADGNEKTLRFLKD